MKNLAILLFLAFSTALNSQNPEWMHFRTYNVNDICSDGSNLWLASEPIGIMNIGNSSFTYLDKFFINEPNTVYIDRKGKIWMANNNEVYYFENDEWVNFAVNHTEFASNKGKIKFAEDNEDNFYILFGNNLFKMNNQEVEKIDLSKYNFSAGVINISIDENNNIWLSIGDGFIKFNYDSSEYVRLPWTDDAVYDIDFLPDSNLLVATGSGLQIYNQNKEFVRTAMSWAKQIEKDDNGLFWIATEQGVYSFDGITYDTYSTFEGLQSNIVQKISVKNNIVWVLTDAGISKIENEKVVNIEITGMAFTFNYIYQMVQDNAGTYWFRSSTNVYEMKDFKFEKFEDLIRPILANNLEIDKSGNLWMGCNTKIYKLYNSELKKYIFSNELPVEYKFAVYADENGDVFAQADIGSWGSHNFIYYKYNIQNDEFEPFEKYKEKKIQRMLKDNLGRIWMLTDEYLCYSDEKLNLSETLNKKYIANIFFQGDSVWVTESLNNIHLFDGKEWKTIDISNLKLGNIFFSDVLGYKNKIYFSTIGGVLIYSDGKFEVMTKHNSPLLSNYQYHIFEDKNENLWFVSPEGISVFKEGGVIIDVKESVNSKLNILTVNPNPAHNRLQVSYYLKEKTDVDIKIFNINGIEVMNLKNINSQLGDNNYLINTENLNSGIYLLTMYANNNVIVEKIIIFK